MIVIRVSLISGLVEGIINFGYYFSCLISFCIFVIN